MIITKGDRNFIVNILMPHFRIRTLEIVFSKSKAKWPDIWVEIKPSPERLPSGMFIMPIPRITVTKEWQSQNMHERRKRLTHECIHLTGKDHDIYKGLDYNTKPELDTYSEMIYRKILSAKD